VRKPSGFIYGEVFAVLLKHYPEAVKKYMNEHGKETKKEDDLSIKHNFGEITSQQDFYTGCLEKKACAIALLPAIDSIQWEEKAHNERLQFLQEMDKSAEKNLIPVHYKWVNITCHPEWLKYFDVQPFAAPSVVYYNPTTHKHESTIG